MSDLYEQIETLRVKRDDYARRSRALVTRDLVGRALKDDITKELVEKLGKTNGEKAATHDERWLAYKEATSNLTLERDLLGNECEHLSYAIRLQLAVVERVGSPALAGQD